MIIVDKVSRYYGDTKAVDNVSFKIKSGEIVGLLGHNGAGKTTIMKMLTGFIEPSSGSILIDCHNIIEQPDLARLDIGYLPENLPVYPEMTVIEYLEYVGSLKGLNSKNNLKRVKEAIDKTELNKKAFSEIHTLSRGYKQRVGVAQAILNNPKWLILDEPTNGLDPSQINHMRQLIKNIAADATVILSTHIMQEVDAVCSRVMILKDGQLAVDQSLDSLRQGKNIILQAGSEIKSLANQLRSNNIEEAVFVNKNQYLLKVGKQYSIDETIAKVTKLLVTNNIDIYKITPEQRNLESIFNDVNKVQEKAHAA